MFPRIFRTSSMILRFLPRNGSRGFFCSSEQRIESGPIIVTTIANHGPNFACVRNALRRIRAKDDQIGGMAWLDGSELFFVSKKLRCAEGGRLQRFHGRESRTD